MKNVLLLAMSILPRDFERDNYYKDSDGNVYVARSQLEPVTHMLFDKYRNTEKCLNEIVILETKGTVDTSKWGFSAVDFYKERVDSFAEGIQYKDIAIDENAPAEGIQDAVRYILQENNRQIEKGERLNLWLDTQGGFRDIVMIINAIISLLQELDIYPEGIYSIQYRDRNSEAAPCDIVDQKENYKIFEFVSAMQEFMDFGKATGLKKYYKDRQEYELVEKVGAIADAIQMCRPQKFEDALLKFADYVNTGKHEKNDPYLQIFLDFMKNDYGVLLEKPGNTIEQIRWCLRKDFYQQAMTIYIEKMPEYYYKCGVVDVQKEPGSKPAFGKNPYAESFYTGLFDEMLQDDKDALFVQIMEEASKIDDIHRGRNAVRYFETKSKTVENAMVRKAINRLTNELGRRFDRIGEPTEFQKSEEEGGHEKTVRSYINMLLSNSRKRYKLLYWKEKPQQEGMYIKIEAIRAAKEKKPQFVKIMEYYLAVKLLRNRMNHASEEGIKEDELAAINFLRDEQIDIGIRMGQGEREQAEVEFDYQRVRAIIEDGLRFSGECNSDSFSHV